MPQKKIQSTYDTDHCICIVPCLACDVLHHKMTQTGLQTSDPQRKYQQTMVALHSLLTISFDKAHIYHQKKYVLVFPPIK